MRYSVLTYIVNDYEIVHEIEEKDPEAEYILVTDDDGIMSDTWTVVVDKSLSEYSPFDKTFAIRYNCFKYCNTDICVRIDGSIGILHSLKPLIDTFENGDYDAALMVHPKNYNFIKEYEDWIAERGYSRKQADRCMAFMSQEGYDFEYKGLFQLCFSIQRRGNVTNDIDNKVMEELRRMGVDGKCERLDQIPFSFVMNKYFSHIKLLPVSEQVLRSYYMQWYKHRSMQHLNPYKESVDDPSHGYAFNRHVETLCLYAPPIASEIARREQSMVQTLYERIYSLQQKSDKRLHTVRMLIYSNIFLAICLLAMIIYNIIH